MITKYIKIPTSEGIPVATLNRSLAYGDISLCPIYTVDGVEYYLLEFSLDEIKNTTIFDEYHWHTLQEIKDFFGI
jgi:hypothetical protein